MDKHEDCADVCQLQEHKGYDTCQRSGECHYLASESPERRATLKIIELNSKIEALSATLARVRRLSAMIGDPRQWVQNEYTTRIAAELRAALDDRDVP